MRPKPQGDRPRGGRPADLSAWIPRTSEPILQHRAEGFMAI